MDADAAGCKPMGCPPPDRNATDRGPTTREAPAGRARRGGGLLLLRHGLAEERQAGRSDAERALSDRGRQRTRAVLEQLVARGLVADRLLSSPLRRAHQTAEIAVHCGLAPALELAPELRPGGDLAAGLSVWLAAPEPPRRLLLVGHEPDLSQLAARLIGAPPGALRLRKAGLIQLNLAESIGGGGAELELLLRPALLLS
jgi:phosphohistidine phosphatase